MKRYNLILCLSSLFLLTGCEGFNAGDLATQRGSESSQGGDSGSGQSTSTPSDIPSEEDDDYVVDHITLSDREKYVQHTGSKVVNLFVYFYDEAGNEISTSSLSDDELAVEWSSSNESIATVSKYGSVSIKGTGDVCITCVTKYAYRHATCLIHSVSSLDDITKEYRLVSDISTLGKGDIIVFGYAASSSVASINTRASDLAETHTTFSGNRITDLGEDAAEFMVGGSYNHWTLEAQNGKYLAAFGENDRVGFVNKTGNIEWEIGIDVDDGKLYIQSAANVYGWMMYNMDTQAYSIYQSNETQRMKLPAIYRLTIV